MIYKIETLKEMRFRYIFYIQADSQKEAERIAKEDVYEEDGQEIDADETYFDVVDCEKVDKAPFISNEYML